MADLSDELRQRLAAKPDQWTLEWWRQQYQEVLKAYRGATHAMNLALAEFEDAQKEIETLRQKILLLEADRAKIGELQARVERMADFLNKQKNGGKL